MTHAGPLPPAVVYAVGALLAGAVLLALTRLILGPSLPDRLVAFDLLAMSVVGAVALSAVGFQVLALLDTALVLALVAFVATVAFADFIRTDREGDPP